MHQMALYCLDWDSNSRSQKVDVLDATSGSTLDSRTMSGFGNGQYLVWSVKGHVKIQVTNLGNINAVASGLFLDGVVSTAPGPVTTATAAFVKTDTTTRPWFLAQ